MANKPKDKIHENAQEVVEDRPRCKGRVDSKSSGKKRGKRCELQSTLLGDEYGEPACQWHGGRPDPKKQRKPRSTTTASLSSKNPAAGGVSVMGTTSNATYSSRWTQLCNGDLSVQDLDTEELAKGMTRNSEGKITGRGSVMVPRSLAQQMKQELFDRAQSILDEDLVTAAEVLGDIARDIEVEPQHRLKAAGMILERVLGKPADTIHIATEKPYEALATRILKAPPKELEAQIIEHQEATGDDRF